MEKRKKTKKTTDKFKMSQASRLSIDKRSKCHGGFHLRTRKQTMAGTSSAEPWVSMMLISWPSFFRRENMVSMPFNRSLTSTKNCVNQIQHVTSSTETEFFLCEMKKTAHHGCLCLQRSSQKKKKRCLVGLHKGNRWHLSRLGRDSEELQRSNCRP